MRITRSTIVFFTVFAIAAIVTALASAGGKHTLEYFFKPLLLITLSIWFYLHSRRYGDSFTLLVQAGLFFSLVGDMALMFEHKDEFNLVIGLGAFLIAVLCYAMAFILNIVDTGGAEGLLVSLGISFVAITYASLFSMDLLPHVDDSLRGAVTGYVIALTLMAIAAAFRFTRTFPRSFWVVLIGVALFITSDSLLAMNRFVHKDAWLRAAVIITYAAAQWLMASGCLLHVLDPEQIRRREALEA